MFSTHELDADGYSRGRPGIPVSRQQIVDSYSRRGAKIIENQCARAQIWFTHELKYIIKSITGWAVGGVYLRRGSVFRMVSHTKAGVVEESRVGLPRPPRNSCVAAANR